MPRMSKQRKTEWAFFLNERGRITYNEKCRLCTHDCKQSFRAEIIKMSEIQIKEEYKMRNTVKRTHVKSTGETK